MNKGKYYITTAIAYTSGKPHIGNSYEIVLADSIARFKRKDGYDVFFQTGTDEHGQKIELKAQEAGVTPQKFVDGVAGQIREICDSLNTSYDKFIRTTDKPHEKQVQKIFKRLYDQGDIYKGAYEGMYCTPCESFWTESQLVDGKCPDCGREVKPAKEEAYFFKMSKYADRLIDHIETHPEFIQPVSRKNEMMNNFLKPGLQDLCVSRTSFKWGIPVDFDDKHVVYVWLDALTNYITGIGYDADGNSTEQYKNMAYVEGSGGLLAEVGSDKADAERREVYVSATDIAAKSTSAADKQKALKKLQQRGREELAASYPVEQTFDGDAETHTASLVYGVDYDLGDRVTCQYRRWGIRVDTVISEIQETYEDGVRRVSVFFGEGTPVISRAMKALTKRS